MAELGDRGEDGEVAGFAVVVGGGDGVGDDDGLIDGQPAGPQRVDGDGQFVGASGELDDLLGAYW